MNDTILAAPCTLVILKLIQHPVHGWLPNFKPYCKLNHPSEEEEKEEIEEEEEKEKDEEEEEKDEEEEEKQEEED